MSLISSYLFTNLTLAKSVRHDPAMSSSCVNEV